MSHGTLEESPRDHTENVLGAAAADAREIARYAAQNVRDAERGLELARLAATAATDRADRARREYIAYRDR